MNLDDALLFRPLFEELLTTLTQLRSMEIPSLESLCETQITLTLLNLRDLCFVVLEFIKNEEARQIIRFISELIATWKAKQTPLIFEAKPENKINIRSKLSHLYLSTIKDQVAPFALEFQARPQ